MIWEVGVPGKTGVSSISRLVITFPCPGRSYDFFSSVFGGYVSLTYVRINRRPTGKEGFMKC